MSFKIARKLVLILLLVIVELPQVISGVMWLPLLLVLIIRKAAALTLHVRLILLMILAIGYAIVYDWLWWWPVLLLGAGAVVAELFATRSQQWHRLAHYGGVIILVTVANLTATVATGTVLFRVFFVVLIILLIERPDK